MYTDNPTLATPQEEASSRVNDALLRAELIRAVRDFQNALKDWHRPPFWESIPDDYMDDLFDYEGGSLPLLLIGLIGIDPETVKDVVLDDPALSEEDKAAMEEMLLAESTWPMHALGYILEGCADDDFILRLLNRRKTSPELVAAFDRVVGLAQNDFLNEGVDHFVDLDRLIEAQSRLAVQLYPGVLKVAGSQYHALVEREPANVDDEYGHLQHTLVYATLLDDTRPVARLKMVAEVDSLGIRFTDIDYFNFKDSIDDDCASFADMLIEGIASEEFEEDSVFDMLRYYHDEPSHNAFLHIHSLEFWQPDLAHGLVMATVLQAAIRGLTETGAGDLMAEPFGTTLADLLTLKAGDSSCEPVPVSWPALCERVTQVFIVDPLDDIDGILDSPHYSSSEKSSYLAQWEAARDAYVSAGQYLPASVRDSVQIIRPEQHDFMDGLLLVAKHNGPWSE